MKLGRIRVTWNQVTTLPGDTICDSKPTNDRSEHQNLERITVSNTPR